MLDSKGLSDHNTQSSALAGMKTYYHFTKWVRSMDILLSVLILTTGLLLWYLFKSHLLLSNFLFNLSFNLDWISIQATVLKLSSVNNIFKVFLKLTETKALKHYPLLWFQCLLGDKSVFYHSQKFMSLMSTITFVFHSLFKKPSFAKMTGFLVSYLLDIWTCILPIPEPTLLPQTDFLVQVTPSYFFTFYAVKTIQSWSSKACPFYSKVVYPFEMLSTA